VRLSLTLVLWWLLWLPVWFLAAPGCAPKNEYVEPPPPTVTVCQPVRQDVTTYIEEMGVTEAFETVEIRARVEGYLEEIHFQDGQTVKAGDPLFVIDRRPYEAERNKAAAAITVAEAELGDAEAKYRRAIPLAKSGAVSNEELTEKAAVYEVAKASIEAKKAALQQAELELSYCDIQSPIAGRVGERLIDRGNFVGRALTAHLTTVISYDPIYARFNISERELLRLMEASPRRANGNDVDMKQIKFYMSLEDEEDFPHEGRFDYADLGVESATGTFLFRGVFPNPPPQRITPGMTVKIRVPTGVLPQALLVPEAAFGADQRGRYVLVVNAQDKVERRDVTAGLKVGDLLVVSKGLEPDEWVITEGVQFVRPGSLVKKEPKQLEPPPPQIQLPSTAPAAAEPKAAAEAATKADAKADAEPAPSAPPPAPADASSAADAAPDAVAKP
jgi:RND family efflux transporter MFP subunit